MDVHCPKERQEDKNSLYGCTSSLSDINCPKDVISGCILLKLKIEIYHEHRPRKR